MKSIIYITTSVWGGCEELWVRSAKDLINKGYTVAFTSRYQHPELDKINAQHIDHSERGGMVRILKKGIERYSNFKFEKKAALKAFIKRINPHLIVISQGHPFQATDIMLHCKTVGIPYVTITQLAADIFISNLADTKLAEIQQAYIGARKNYFVSHHNLQLHNAMLGLSLPNVEVVYNPCKIWGNNVADYPEPHGVYDIGLVGRIDCWHKGCDFLLQIADTAKWRERPVRFNLYGQGPYLDYMKGIIEQRKLSNLIFKGHTGHISQVWADNQILFMPSRMEGQALALIEAMYCQRAAIVTNVGGAAELIEDGHSGFIADLPAVEPINAALERAWQQRDRWQEMGRNAAVALKEKHPEDAIAYFNQKLLQGIEA